jgi:transcription elongation GreA/GreB family factor
LADARFWRIVDSMNKESVRDNDAEVVEPVMDRPVSANPNFVTTSGMAQIDAHLTQLTAAREAAHDADDQQALPGIDRDLRYWRQRRDSAQLVVPAADPEVVRFGICVHLAFADGSRRDFRLVGEDEADPAHGMVSYVSPVGTVLLGRNVGDQVEVFGQRATIAAMVA